MPIKGRADRMAAQSIVYCAGFRCGQYANSSQKVLMRCQVRSAYPAPSHVIGAIRTRHTSSDHELRIDLPLERLTEARGHR